MPGLNAPKAPIAKRGGNFRGRGRGGRDSRDGRGGGFEVGPSEERERGVWTQEKGDKEAMEVMRRMRNGEGGVCGAEEEASEGMREFVELCRMRFGSGREDG